jgi:thiol-disulfide isomerase/thioredoxin
MQTMDIPPVRHQTQAVTATAGVSRRRILGAAAMAAMAGVSGAWPELAVAAYTARLWPVGKPTPEFALTDLEGKAWTLAALRGKPVLLNFWASWCEPCRTEMPSLELLATRHERAGLTVLAVNYRETLPVVQHFLDVQPVSLPILLDREGETTAAWTLRVFPTSVLIDRSGTPRHQVMGGLDWLGADAAALLLPLLARDRAA